LNATEVTVYSIAACRAVSRQRFSKHVPAAMNMYATMEVLLEAVFSAQSMQRGYKEDNLARIKTVGRELPLREDLSLKAEE
jgi:hypothetical protein